MLGAELALEVLELHELDAVLTRDRPVHRDRLREELLERLVRPLDRRLVGRVEHDRRVEVAVAGVPERADGEAVLAGDLLGAPAYLRGPRTRHGRVLEDRERLEAAERRQHGAAGLEDAGRFL